VQIAKSFLVIRGRRRFLRTAGYLLVLCAMLIGCAFRSYQDRLSDIRRTILEPLRNFEGEVPVNCNSSDLEKSALLARYMAASVTSLDLRQQAVALELEVADSALRHGCLDFADSRYRSIISTYIGLGYAAHRQRAEIGLNDVRYARGARNP
jgi:hypothetical protein